MAINNSNIRSQEELDERERLISGQREAKNNVNTPVEANQPKSNNLSGEALNYALLGGNIKVKNKDEMANVLDDINKTAYKTPEEGVPTRDVKPLEAEKPQETPTSFISPEEVELTMFNESEREKALQVQYGLAGVDEQVANYGEDIEDVENRMAILAEEEQRGLNEIKEGQAFATSEARALTKARGEYAERNFDLSQELQSAQKLYNRALTQKNNIQSSIAGIMSSEKTNRTNAKALLEKEYERGLDERKFNEDVRKEDNRIAELEAKIKREKTPDEEDAHELEVLKQKQANDLETLAIKSMFNALESGKLSEGAISKLNDLDLLHGVDLGTFAGIKESNPDSKFIKSSTQTLENGEIQTTLYFQDADGSIKQHKKTEGKAAVDLDGEKLTTIQNIRKSFRDNLLIKNWKEATSKIGLMEVTWKEAEKLQQQIKDSGDNEEGYAASFIAVDQGLISLFNKLLDPESVVRESEYARTSEDQSAISKIEGWFGKQYSGGAGLTMSERSALVNMAKIYKEEGDRAIKPQVQDEVDFALRHDVDPRDIVGESFINGLGINLGDFQTKLDIKADIEASLNEVDEEETINNLSIFN